MQKPKYILTCFIRSQSSNGMLIGSCINAKNILSSKQHIEFISIEWQVTEKVGACSCLTFECKTTRAIRETTVLKRYQLNIYVDGRIKENVYTACALVLRKRSFTGRAQVPIQYVIAVRICEEVDGSFLCNFSRKAGGHAKVHMMNTNISECNLYHRKKTLITIFNYANIEAINLRIWILTTSVQQASAQFSLLL